MSDAAQPPLTRLTRSYETREQNARWLTRGGLLWLLLAVAAGFALRVNRLAAQSLWNDEGTSIALARLSLSAIANGAAHDIHPPLYYFLLHFWMNFAADPSPGSGEFVVRFLSVIAGVLLIVMTFRIAREFFDQEVALIAAFLSALSAFQLYYSQETRMYILVALWSALSVLMLAWMFKPPQTDAPPSPARIGGRTVAWLLYILFTTAALYTHYFAFTLIIFENLAFVVWLLWAWRARRHGLGHSLAFWLAAQVIVALAFLPWLAFAGNQLTSWPAISEPLSLGDVISHVLSAFIFVNDAAIDTQFLIVIGYAIFFIAGLLPSLDLYKQSIWGIILNLLWGVVPLAAMYVISLQRPAYNPKFLLLATPGFFILVARGLSILYPGFFLRARVAHYDVKRSPLMSSLLAWRPLLTVGIVAAGALLALRGVYDDPRLQRDDYRGVARYINAVATQADAVLVDAPGQLDVFRYYYRGAAELVALPLGRPLQKDTTRAALEQLVLQHQNLFAVFWATEQADPENFIEKYLSATAFKAKDEWHGNLRLAEYALPDVSQVFDGGVRFGSAIELHQFGIGNRAIHAGQILPLSLEWYAIQPPAANYKIFVHLLDGKNQIVGQSDAEPLGGFHPTSDWHAGELVRDKVGLLIYPGTPPGDYTLEIGLYRADDGARLRVKDGQDHLVLGTLGVEKVIASRDALPLSHSLNAELGALTLLGYNLPRAQVKHGDALSLELYWQAREQPSQAVDLGGAVQLIDSGGRVIAQERAFALYPTSRWETGEIVREVYRLAIPANASQGQYTVLVVSGARSAELTRLEIQ